MRAAWLGIASLLVVGTSLVAAQKQARQLLDRVDAQYKKIDQRYRSLDWGVHYTDSDQTEADLDAFATTGIRDLVSLSDLRWLRLFKQVTLSAALRQEIERTLGVLDFYLAKAKLEPSQDKLELMSVLEKRLYAFSYDDGHGCKLSYRELSGRLNDLSPHKPYKGDARCLVAASRAFVERIQSPAEGAQNLFRDYMAALAERFPEKIWTDAEYAELVGIWRSLHARLESPEGKKVELEFQDAFTEAGSIESAQRFTQDYYRALGFDLGGVSFEKKAKHGVNFGGLTGLLAPQDIRVMVGPEYVKQPSYLTMMIHEMGHAVAHTSIQERLYAYWSDAEGEVGEAFADLMLAMFEETESLKRTGFKPFVRLAERTDPKLLRLRTPAALQFDLNVAEQRYQIMQVREHQAPPLETAARFLREWPVHRFNHVKLDGVTDEERALLLFVWEIEPLTSYPLYCRGYVEAAMIIANVMNRTISGGERASWEQLEALALKLRAVFAPGGKIKDPAVLVGGLGVDTTDREAFFRNYRAYLGL